MKIIYSHQQVLGLVWQAVYKAGSMRALAREVGISPSFISDVLLGHRKVGVKLLLHLKVRREVVYTREV